LLNNKTLDKDILLESHLILQDINCEYVDGASKYCKATRSRLTYVCRPGFKFENNQRVFNSKCKYNEWEEVPRCLPGLFLVYSLKR
jgi:hypothetical protein